MNSISKLSCPICNTDSSFIFSSKHSRKIYECANEDCGHFFTPPSANSQGICIRNEDIERESDESMHLFNERNKRLLSLLLGFLKKKEYPITLIDFGAGNAHISRTFKLELGNKAKIYCLEPNPICTGLYKKYGLLHLLTINDLPEKIDLIYMIEVIEHLEDPIATLNILSQHLDKNGLIFLSTPVGRKLESTTNAYDTPSHLHFFTEKSLNLALKKAGLSEIHYKFYPEIYPLPLPLPLQAMFGRPIILIKKLIKKFFLLVRKESRQINHLVGATKLKR